MLQHLAGPLADYRAEADSDDGADGRVHLAGDEEGGQPIEAAEGAARTGKKLYYCRPSSVER